MRRSSRLVPEVEAESRTLNVRKAVIQNRGVDRIKLTHCWIIYQYVHLAALNQASNERPTMPLAHGEFER